MKSLHSYLKRFVPQYGIKLPGETFVRLQPSYEAAALKAETVLVYNLEHGKWQEA